jgi:hypothetical protein
MADKQTRVIYTALADFAAVRAEAAKTTAALDAMRASEKAANADSVSGSKASVAGHDNVTSSVESEGKAFDSTTSSVAKHLAAIVSDSNAAKESAAQHNAAASAVSAEGAAHRAATSAIDGAESAESALTATIKKAAAARAAEQAAIKKSESAAKSEQTTWQRAVSVYNSVATGATKLGKGLDKLYEQKSQSLNAPWAALIPIFGGLIALVNPLVAGLGAAGAAALGFGNNLVSLAGSAAAILPALGAVIASAGAIKVAFGGISNVFKAYQTSQTASGGGGGGGSADNTIQLSQTQQITRANETYKNSIQDVTFAQQDLTAAKQTYIQTLKQLETEVARAAAAEADAAASTQLAKENYADVLADPGSTKGQKMDAAAQVTDAQNNQADVTAQNKQNASDLAAMQKTGIDGDRQVILAQRAVVAAQNAVVDAQIALENAQNGSNKSTGAAASAANAYAAALNKLSPSARAVVLEIIGMQGAWDKLQRTVQEDFFSQIVKDVGNLKVLFPPVTQLLGSLATVLGGFAHNILAFTVSPTGLKDLGTFTAFAAPFVKDVGTGLGILAKGLLDVSIAALPFTQALGKDFQKGATALGNLLSADAKNGKLEGYLNDTLGTLKTFYSILSNIVGVIANYSQASKDFSKGLLDGFEGITAGWLKASQQANKQGSPFKTWLTDIQPVLSQLRGIIGGFFSWIAQQSENPKNIKTITDILSIIKTQLAPALASILDSLNKSGIGKDLVKALSTVAGLLADLLKNGGANGLVAFYNIIITIAGALDKFVKALPPGTMTVLVGGFLTLSALRFAGLAALAVMKFTGITSLAKYLVANLSKIQKASEAISEAGSANSVGGVGGGAAPQVNLPSGRGVEGEAGGVARDVEEGATVASDVGKASTLGKVASVAGGAALDLSGLRVFLDLFKGFKGVSAAKKAASTVEDVAGTAAKGNSSGVGSVIKKVLGGGAKAGGAGADVGEAAEGASLIGKVAGVAGGVAGIGGLVGTIGGDVLAGTAPKGKAGNDQRVAGKLIAGVSTGAGIGAAAGSVIPGVGTAVGAVAGGAIGGATSFFSQPKKDRDQFIKDTTTAIGTFFSKTLPDLVVANGKDIWKGLQTLGAWITTGVKDLSNALTHLPQEIAFAAGFIWAKLPGLLSWFESQYTAAQKWIGNLPHNIAVAVGNIWRFITDMNVWLNAQGVKALAWFKNLPANIKKWAGDLFRSVVTIDTWLSSQGTKFTNWLKNIPANTKKTASHIFDDLVSIQSWVDTQTKIITDFFKNIPSLASKWAGNFFGSIGNAFKSGEKAGNKYNGGVIKRAGGGFVPGIASNSDTVPSMLTPKEYVLRKSIVNRIGVQNLDGLNSGIMSYAQLLQKLMATKGKSNSAVTGLGATPTSGGTSFFAGGGLVPTLPGGGSSGSVMGGLKGSKPVVTTTDNSMNFGDIIINNPTPEPASDSIPKAVRKAGYIVPTRRAS